MNREFFPKLQARSSASRVEFIPLLCVYSLHGKLAVAVTVGPTEAPSRGPELPSYVAATQLPVNYLA